MTRPTSPADLAAGRSRARAMLLFAASALALAACSDGGGGSSASAPMATPSAPPPASAPAPAGPRNPTTPDSRGVLVYPDYAAVVARRGDTVQAMALRVGLSAAELAAYNGLPTSYVPTPGDELVLPPRAGGYSAGPSAAAASAPQALSQAPTAPVGAAPAAAVTAVSTPAPAATPAATSAGWSPSVVEGALQRTDGAAAGSPRLGMAAASGPGGSDVGYHDVEEGETIYSIARQYGVTPEALISWNALSGPNYTVTAGQVLVIPAAGSAGGDGAAPLYPPGGEGTATPPPSSGAPLPPDTVQARPLASPNMSQYQSGATPPAAPAAAPVSAAAPASAPVSAPVSAPTSAPAAAPVQTASVEQTPAPAPSVTPGKLSRPVPGRIVSSFNRSGSGQRNDGVDFAATAGEPVSAAAAGTVALVSRSLGEWGNIVLVRHSDEMMTVYSRLGDIDVTKGETVSAGQRIGSVGAPTSGSATLHFEVRKGAFSEDPEKYF